MATFVGMIVAAGSLLSGLIYLVGKITHWYQFVTGIAPLLIGMFFLSAVQLLFVGMIGEYILNINMRTLHRPLVIEEDRINLPKRKKE